MNNSARNKWITEIISALFIILFLYTSLNKIFEHGQFQLILSKSQLIGNWATMVSYLLPAAEIMISVLLLIPRTRMFGLWSSLAMMILFTAYISNMIVFTPRLPCSCGGVLKQLNWKEHLLFNLFFVTLAITGISISHKRNCVHKAGEAENLNKRVGNYSLLKQIL